MLAGDELADLRKRAEERETFLHELRRSKAELDNFQKRVRRDRGQWEEQAVGRFVRELLPVVDNFERALLSMDSSDAAGIEQGVRLIHQMMVRAFSEQGVEEIPADGSFDPELHEAMAQDQVDDRPTGEITGVLEKGYRFRSLVLRPSKVRVALNVTESKDAPKAGGAGPRPEGGASATAKPENTGPPADDPDAGGTSDGDDVSEATES